MGRGLFDYFDPNDVILKICLWTNKVAIYGKRKKCWSNVKLSFSDSQIWPGKLKVEMEYQSYQDLLGKLVENTWQGVF